MKVGKLVFTLDCVFQVILEIFLGIAMVFPPLNAPALNHNKKSATLSGSQRPLFVPLKHL